MNIKKYIPMVRWILTMSKSILQWSENGQYSKKHTWGHVKNLVFSNTRYPKYPMILKMNRVRFGYWKIFRVRVGYRVPVGPCLAGSVQLYCPDVQLLSRCGCTSAWSGVSSSSSSSWFLLSTLHTPGRRLGTQIGTCIVAKCDWNYSCLLRYGNYQENESKGWLAALLTFTIGMWVLLIVARLQGCRIIPGGEILFSP